MPVKRRRLFAFLKNEPPQRTYVALHFVILVSILVAVVWVADSLFRHYILSASTIEASHAAFEYHLKDLFRDLFLRTVIIFAAGFLVMAIAGLMFLHRITGPLVRVRHVINELADGKFPDDMIQFRRGDFSKELGLALSRLLDFLNRTRVPIQKSEN